MRSSMYTRENSALHEEKNLFMLVKSFCCIFFCERKSSKGIQTKNGIVIGYVCTMILCITLRIHEESRLR